MPDKNVEEQDSKIYQLYSLSSKNFIYYMHSTVVPW